VPTHHRDTDHPIVASTGRASSSGAFPAALSTLSTLPNTVDVLRSITSFPPSYVGTVSPVLPLLFRLHGSQRENCLVILHVYLSLHTDTGFSALRRVVNYGVQRISNCLLFTRDHKSWTNTLPPIYRRPQIVDCILVPRECRKACAPTDTTRSFPNRDPASTLGPPSGRGRNQTSRASPPR